MGVELFIHRESTVDPEHFSMTGATGWETVWLPAAAELGLDLIPRMVGGSFNPSAEELPAVTEQLSRLREWMARHGHDLYVEHLDDILPALTTVRAGRDDISWIAGRGHNHTLQWTGPASGVLID